MCRRTIGSSAWRRVSPLDQASKGSPVEIKPILKPDRGVEVKLSGNQDEPHHDTYVCPERKPLIQTIQIHRSPPPLTRLA